MMSLVWLKAVVKMLKRQNGDDEDMADKSICDVFVSMVVFSAKRFYTMSRRENLQDSENLQDKRLKMKMKMSLSTCPMPGNHNASVPVPFHQSCLVSAVHYRLYAFMAFC